jgi:hypothetical protein
MQRRDAAGSAPQSFAMANAGERMLSVCGI